MSYATLSPYPVWQITDAIGGAIPGSLLYVYQANTDIPITTYTDASMTVAASNPIVADAEGRLSVWLDPSAGSVKMILTDGVGIPDIISGRTGTQIWSKDYIAPIGGSGGTQYVVENIAALKALQEPEEFTIATVLGYYLQGDGGGGVFYWDQSNADPNDDGVTIQPTTSTGGRWIRQIGSEINVRWFGAKGTGSFNDTPYFEAADAFCETGNYTLLADAGTYLLSTDPTLTTPIRLLPSAIIMPSGDGYAFDVIIEDDTKHFMTSYYVTLQAGITVKPQWFGAVADGSTDDTAAVRKAAEAIPAAGGTLYFKSTATSYLVGDVSDYIVTLKSKMSIRGDGEASCLKQKNTTNSLYAIIGHDIATPLSGVSIRDVGINGNMTNNTSGVGILVNSVGGDISNCSIFGCFNKAIDSYSNYFQISKNILLDNGMLIESADHLTVDKNKITATSNNVHSSYGISVTPGASRSIVDTDIFYNILVGCPILATAAPTSRQISSLNISNNTVDLSRYGLGGYSGTSCIQIYGATGYVAVDNNTLYLQGASTGGGVFIGDLATVRDCQYDVTGNIIRMDANTIGTYHNGVNVVNVSGAVIKDNNIRSSVAYIDETTTDYGIKESGTCINVLRVSNVILNLVDYTMVDDTSITEGSISIEFSTSYFTTLQTTTLYWKRIAPTDLTYPVTIQLTIKGFEGTSNATSCHASGTPITASLRPNISTYYGGVTIIDNGGQSAGCIYISAAGHLYLGQVHLFGDLVSYSTSVFTASNGKGLPSQTITYTIWPA